jgi:hypothetical protein
MAAECCFEVEPSAHGKGFLCFFALWLASGRRPYPRWLAVLLGCGWLTVAGLMTF